MQIHGRDLAVSPVNFSRAFACPGEFPRCSRINLATSGPDEPEGYYPAGGGFVKAIFRHKSRAINKTGACTRKISHYGAIIMKSVSNNGVGRLPIPNDYRRETVRTRYHYRYLDSAKSNRVSIAAWRPVKRKRERNNK